MAQQRTLDDSSSSAPTSVVFRRSKRHNVVAGICGGLAEYLGIDPVFVRLLLAPLVLFYGVGLAAYVAAYFIIPEEQDGEVVSFPPGSLGQRAARQITGVITMTLGLAIAVVMLMPSFNWFWFAPAGLVFVGLMLLAFGTIRR